MTAQFGEVRDTGRVLRVTLELRTDIFRWQREIFPIDSRAVEHPSLVAGPVFKTGEVRREAFLASSIPVLYRHPRLTRKKRPEHVTLAGA